MELIRSNQRTQGSADEFLNCHMCQYLKKGTKKAPYWMPFWYRTMCEELVLFNHSDTTKTKMARTKIISSILGKVMFQKGYDMQTIIRYKLKSLKYNNHDGCDVPITLF